MKIENAITIVLVSMGVIFLVRWLLRKILVYEIFDRIKRVESNLVGLSMHRAMFKRAASYEQTFSRDVAYCQEEVNIRKVLNDFLLNLKYQDLRKFLMTKEEKEKYSSIFDDFEESKQELKRTQEFEEEMKKLKNKRA